MSAIKAVLSNGGIEVQEDQALLASLMRACRLKNDKYNMKLTIRKSVIKLLLKKVRDKFGLTQPYLETLYTVLILATYYGMFRIGEVIDSPHVIKAKDVYIGTNKPKLMFILHSSKTHNPGDKPQIVKITAAALPKNGMERDCPFQALEKYLAARPKRLNDSEPFFIFRDRSPVALTHYRKLLKQLMKLNRLDYTRYGIHGMRAGRAVDLLELGVSVETIRKLGRWKSTSVYAYLRTLLIH